MRTAVLCVFLLSLSSCSWTYKFRVYNKTGQDLRVRYTFYNTDTSRGNYHTGIFSQKVEVVKRKGQEKDSLYAYQYMEDSNAVEFMLKKDQVATIGWGRNTHYKWLMELKKGALYSYDSLVPWVNRFNLEELLITNVDSQIFIREFMLDSLVKGKKSAETRLVLCAEL